MSESVQELECLIHELFEFQVEKSPEETAVIFGSNALSYIQLNGCANDLAEKLQSQGVGPETYVAICLDRCLEQVIAVLAILKAGGAFVPIDPRCPEARIKTIFETAGIRHAVAKDGFGMIDLKLLVNDVISFDIEQLDKRNNRNVISDASPESAAYVIFTSGSTGTPKGVVLEHRNICNMTSALSGLNIDCNSRVLQFASLAFGGAISEIFCSLLSGASLFMAEQNELIPGPRLASYIRKNQITFLKLTPSVLGALPCEEYPSLKVIMVAGEMCTQDIIDKWSEKCILLNGYGMTETGPYGTIAHLNKHSSLNDVGSCTPGTEIYILDDKQIPLGSDQEGEIYISCQGVAREYVNLPEESKKRFVIFPPTGKRIYRTGDIGHFKNNGSLHLTGRSDNQVQFRGVRIELSEIDSKLVEHDEIVFSKTLLKKDIVPGGCLISYVLLDGEVDGNLNQESITEYLKKYFPYYMVPSFVVLLDNVPMNVNGKIDIKKLPIPKGLSLRSGAQSSTTNDAVGKENIKADLKKSDEIVQDIVNSWEEALNIKCSKFDDDFFDVGGNSITLIGLLAKVYSIYPADIDIEMFYQNPTLGHLIFCILGENLKIKENYIKVSALKMSEQMQYTGYAPLLPNNYWLLQRANVSYWNASRLFELVKPYKSEILQEAIEYLLLYHDGLRRILVNRDGKWSQYFQSIHEMAPWWERVDLSLVGDDQAGEIIEKKCAEGQASLDISKVLFKVIYFDLGESENARLMFVIHHFLIDGLSYSVFLSDLNKIYDLLKENVTPELPEKIGSIYDWAYKLETYAQSEALKAISYWRSLPWERYIALPEETDKDKLVPDDGIIEELKFVTKTLKGQDCLAIETICKEYNVEVYHLLVLALVLAYGEWAGKPVLCLNLTHNGRVFPSHIGMNLYRVIGWLSNYTQVLLDLTGLTSFKDLILSVKEQLEELERHDLGVSYSCLRFMTDDQLIRDEVKSLPLYNMEFNFVQSNEMSSVEKKYTGRMRDADEFRGPDEKLVRSDQKPFVSACYGSEKIELTLGYSPAMYTEKTMDALLEEVVSSFRAVTRKLV